MWTTHQADPAKYPLLAKVADDTGDGVPEINRPEEIDALIASVTQVLADAGYPMEGKRVVWVMNDRVHRSGAEYRLVEKHDWEASPFANVHKYSHDIYPASAALGVNGCRDCHHPVSSFFYASIMQYPFDTQAEPVLASQAEILGIGHSSSRIGIFREEILKPLFLWIIATMVILFLVHYVVYGAKRRPPSGMSLEMDRSYATVERLTHLGLMLTFLGLVSTGFVSCLTQWLPAETIKTFHLVHRVLGFAFAFFTILITLLWHSDARFHRDDWEWCKRLGGYFGRRYNNSDGRFNAGQKIYFWTVVLFVGVIWVTGFLLILGVKDSWLGFLFTVHVIVAGIFIMAVLVHLYLVLLLNPGSLPKLFDGSRAKPQYADMGGAQELRRDL